MREVIKNKLVSELPDLSGRCYDIGEPAAATTKPYATVRLAKQSSESAWTGQKNRYEVALYGEPDAAADLDLWVDQAVQALHGVRLASGGTDPDFTCRYEGTENPEQMDAALQALVRFLTFSVMAVGAEEVPSSGSPLDAVCSWTAGKTGPEWHVYRQSWPQHYAAPAVLWRFEQMEAANVNAATTELRHKAVGHVFGRTLQEQEAMVRKLSADLAGTNKLQLDTVARTYIASGEVTADFTADALTKGQLSVIFRQKIAKSADEAPLIGQVHADGGFG